MAITIATGKTSRLGAGDAASRIPPANGPPNIRRLCPGQSSPEIMPEEAARYAFIVVTGRSDYPNQINKVPAFPVIFHGALDVRATQIRVGPAGAIQHRLLRAQDHPAQVSAPPVPHGKGIDGR